jgi:hypothetical protein
MEKKNYGREHQSTLEVGTLGYLRQFSNVELSKFLERLSVRGPAKS